MISTLNTLPADWKDSIPAVSLIEINSETEILDTLKNYVSDTTHFGSLFFGDHDPYDVPLSRCRKCNNKSPMIKKTLDKKYLVSCKCNNSGPVKTYPREAIFSWNLSDNSYEIPYRTSPLFKLGGLTPELAKDRLFKVTASLNIRLEIIRRDKIYNNSVSPGYIGKQIAYRDWAFYLFELVKRDQELLEGTCK